MLEATKAFLLGGVGAALMSFAASSGAAGSSPPRRNLEAADVLARLQAWLDATRTLDCRFEQRLVSSALGSSFRETGRLRVERPGRMRWDYDEPDPKVALLVGEATFLYLPEDRQLVLGKLAEADRVLPELLAGRRLEEAFRATRLDSARKGGTGAWRLELEPRQPVAGIEAVVLAVDPRDFRILSADLLDGAGGRTEFTFRCSARNRSLDAGLFQFTPPPGTEVVESP